MPPVKKEPSLWDNIKNSVKPVDKSYQSEGKEQSLAKALGVYGKPKTNYLQFSSPEQYKQYKKNKGY